MADCENYLRDTVTPWLHATSTSKPDSLDASLELQNGGKQILDRLYEYKMEISSLSQSCDSPRSPGAGGEDAGLDPLTLKAKQVHTDS